MNDPRSRVPPLWWQAYRAGVVRCPQDFRYWTLKEFPELEDRFLGGAPPDNSLRFDAPERLKAPPTFAQTRGFLAQHERADWQGVDLMLRLWACKFVQIARKRYGIPLYVQCAYRGKRLQDDLYKQGTSKARFPNSAHNRGAAVDIVHSVHHWQLSPQEWIFLGKIGRAACGSINAYRPRDVYDKPLPPLELEWGGDWRRNADGIGWDPAHWEIKHWKLLPVIAEAQPLRLSPFATAPF